MMEEDDEEIQMVNPENNDFEMDDDEDDDLDDFDDVDGDDDDLHLRLPVRGLF
jgi:hypothetical protein